MDGDGPSRGGAQSWAAARAGRWRDFVAELRRRLGSGEPLAPGERGRFEGQLGVDLGAVMVHRAPFAGRVAATIGADAFATGGHVLGSGERLHADTPRGAALLGHELTHAAQQTAPIAVPSPAPPVGGGPRSWSVAGQGASVQRAATEGEAEAAAQATEATVLGRAAPQGGLARGEVDPEALAERVYRRMVETLHLERERSAGLG